ncbi:hypothetical protein BOX15_Mlig031238g1 [Macrostomum lignano]|uniref:Uncharacterized protein n=1 Tax=Macrostomum lignano TaxID=282301 RepID=A0A267FBK6_9PLAT|nr:hypothetical protein BOX15_Mlig031238g1 [Macrostomum lignano]
MTKIVEQVIRCAYNCCNGTADHIKANENSENFIWTVIAMQYAVVILPIIYRCLFSRNTD